MLEAALFPVRAVKGLIEAADDALPLVVKVSIISCQCSDIDIQKMLFHHDISLFLSVKVA